VRYSAGPRAEGAARGSTGSKTKQTQFKKRKLRTLRNRQGLSLRQLATEMGYASHNHLAGIERGERKPSVELVIKIALFFEVSTDQLLLDELELVKDNEEE